MLVEMQKGEDTRLGELRRGGLLTGLIVDDVLVERRGLLEMVEYSLSYFLSILSRLNLSVNNERT